MENKEKELIEYITDASASKYILTIIGIIALIMGISQLLSESDVALGFCLALIGLGGVCLLVGILNIIQNKSQLSKEIKNYKESGTWEEIVNDFNTSQPFAQDSIRAGENYLFGMHSNSIVKYKNIYRIYLKIYKTNGVETDRQMKIEKYSGHPFTIKVDEKSGQILAGLILKKNPEVRTDKE